LKVSVIIPVERVGGDAERAIASILAQEAAFPFELIVVSAAELTLPSDNRLTNVVEANRNPATRRNRAVSTASGEILAFMDDDAVADRRWIATAGAYFDAHPDVLALGGPDPAPPASPPDELISDTLLRTPWIGSGIACHEDRRGIFAITHPSDIALVNLFVRRAAFTGFDESVGYIGEDTRLIAELMQRGTVMYHGGVRVFHRRRAFPGPYLRQRWRYRVKTGQMLRRHDPAYTANRTIRLFFAAAFVGIVTLPFSLIVYYIGVFVLAARATQLPPNYWPLLPFAFMAHHATYLLGISWGWLRGRNRLDSSTVTRDDA
jgi:glycosyltransferase involved in cell wall biosynthesis